MKLAGIFGPIPNPFAPTGLNVSNLNTSDGSGMVVLINNLYKFAIVIAGIYTLMNLLLAGYAYIGSAGDPKLLQKATERIWRSVLGLTIIAGSVIIAAIIGYVIFGPDNWDLLINPKVY